MFITISCYPRKIMVFIGGVLLVGLILRLWGIHSGLPDLYHTDEATIVTRSLMTARNHLDPEWVGYPSLWFYVLGLVYGIYYVVGTILGQFSGIESFALQFIKDPTYFYVIPRFLSSLLGICIPLIALLIGTKFFNKGVGIVSAIILTFHGAIVEHSHYATLDIPATFLTMLALYAILNVYVNATLRNYIIAGLTIGLGISIKYLPIISFASLIVCHIFLYFEEKTKHSWLILGGVFLVIGFLAGTPFFIKNVFSLQTYVQNQHFQVGYFETLKSNFTVLIRAIGWLSFIIFLFSAVHAFMCKDKRSVIILSFIICYFFSISIFSKSYYERWHLPYLTAIYLIIAMGICEGYKKVGNRKLLQYGIYICVVALICAEMLRIVGFLNWLSLPDTRIIAKKWVEKNIPDRSGIFLDSGRYFSNFGVPIKGVNIDLGKNIYMESAKLDGMESNIRSEGTINYYDQMIEKLNTSPKYRLVRSSLAYPLVLNDTINEEWFKANTINYAILSSYYFMGFFDTHRVVIKGNDEKIKIFYESLFKKKEIIMDFKPEKNVRGPHIIIISLTKD